MRNLSPAALRAALSDHGDDPLLVFLEFSCAELPVPVRVVHNHESITADGMEFLACSFEISFPVASAEDLPSVQITVQNVDRRLVEAVRTVSGRVCVSLFAALASTPSAPEYGPYDFVLTRSSYDALVVTGELSLEEDLLNETVPCQTFSPINFPGLFS